MRRSAAKAAHRPTDQCRAASTILDTLRIFRTALSAKFIPLESRTFLPSCSPLTSWS
jgi:hypothetical protein